MILNRVFRYTLGDLKGEKELDFQNMFHYLVHNNEPKMLNAWLLPKTNYFTDGAETSPMSLATVTCAK
jgi:hypothetical protein